MQAVIFSEDAILLTPDQVAVVLGLSRRTITTRKWRDRLPWLKLGPRTLRLPAGDLNRFQSQLAGTVRHAA